MTTISIWRLSFVREYLLFYFVSHKYTCNKTCFICLHTCTLCSSHFDSLHCMHFHDVGTQQQGQGIRADRPLHFKKKKVSIPFYRVILKKKIKTYVYNSFGSSTLALRVQKKKATCPHVELCVYNIFHTLLDMASTLYCC